jgi:ribosomal protein L15
MTTEKPKLTGQGGPGRGQGRRPGVGNKGRTPRRMVSFKSPVEIIDRLRQEKNYTALIVRLLKEHYGM